MSHSTRQDARGGATDVEIWRPAIIDGWRPLAKHFGVNARQHWRAAAKQVALAHGKTLVAMLLAGWLHELPGPTVVRITIRQARGKQPDSDALVILPKAIRDQVASWFGVDDGPGGPITWEYAWERGADGVLIELEERSA